MKHFIIGTAGHVDHGKTRLIKALTGQETDRLKEEKERGISIELGFAPFQLPSGTLAGVVDVPGHERFIKNMLAGVGGMDLVILVVAADEGIMPQTREHLDIIDLLQVQKGIIVITKTDLVDEEWLDLVQEEIIELVKETVLEDAPVVPVSSVTGAGIGELIELIDRTAENLRERPAAGYFRMPVDRVFSKTGFGTVVTGTLLSGRLRLGDVVEILPDMEEARVRTLQVHGTKVEEALAGQRVAVNLAGTERETITRGSVIAAPGMLNPSHRLDVQLKLISGIKKSLANRARVRVHIGTSEILARVILLEKDELEPGESGFIQLECEEAIVAARDDLLVIRSYSPMTTIGGGKVIDSAPPKRKRFHAETIEILRTKAKGTPEELLHQFMLSSGQAAHLRDDLARGGGFDEATTEEAINKLTAQGLLRQFTSENKIYFMLDSFYTQKADEIAAALEKYHTVYPLRSGISKEEIRSRFFPGMSNKLFSALMDIYRVDEVISIMGENIAKKGFQPEPQGEQIRLFPKIEGEYLAAGFQTPGWEDIKSAHRLVPAESEEILNYFINKKVLVKLEDNVLIHRANLDKARNLLVGFLEEKGEITLGEARDLLNTSRKFALPVMAYFDKERITRRIDDKRVLY
ncbi:selenocysteine-specific translation elongation factor [Phosphitispora fastidiosa]|uniref:selenocysteine-specific translation elongation factor n=1 Tax=Phosphitispora fastidiosa TaxID=2837202 RepID=UPI001E52B3E3|nr:selenocysteine-specific translation elongation factor [Phosphitispora fastidiosa]MBU7006647.1 selenocysteine-specific elongation factor [Phosphitispora fastidiosa]